MTATVSILILIAGAIGLWWLLRRSTEIFCIEVVQGRVRVVRGAAPPRLVGDLGDVLGRPKVERARLRVVSDSGHARVEVVGGALSDAHLQRVRNVVGTWPLARLRSARR